MRFLFTPVFNRFDAFAMIVVGSLYSREHISFWTMLTCFIAVATVSVVSRWQLERAEAR